MSLPGVASPVPAPSSLPPRLAWHHAAVEEVAAYWQTDLATGLSAVEARDRLGRLGANRLPEEPPKPLWRRVLAQVSDFTVLALLGAAAIAAGLGLFAPEPGTSGLERFGDACAILAIVVVNAIIGLLQETRAERALLALRQMTSPTARLVRDGKVVETPSKEVVPGDVMLVEDGDRIVADVRLVEAHDFEVDEAALTGESMPVPKDAGAALPSDAALAERATMAFMGTRACRGRARGLVANTGVYTELGAIAGMLARLPPEKTPLEKDLERFGQRIVLGCVAVSAAVFAAGFFRGNASARELFLVAVALAVAAIPEGLPAVTTIVLALGTQRMARRNALVRRLPAVETLGCAQVICTDKTGTLTQNAMTARKLWIAGARFDVIGAPRRRDGGIMLPSGEPAPASADLRAALDVAAHARGAHLSWRLASGEGAARGEASGDECEIQGDPTDAALLILARRAGVETEHRRVLGEQPFSSARRMASVLLGGDGAVRACVRGAPEALLERSTTILRGGRAEKLEQDDRDAILGEAAKWAGRSMRVIALAVRQGIPLPIGPVAATAEWEEELTFVGLVGIVDPPRPEVAAAIAEARKAGIRTLMITGDHPATARAIGEELGLLSPEAEIVTGAELDRIDQQKLEERIDRISVVARATAEHKLRIVDALKARGFICAMTGDGVNDAPAVKAASIGVAMGKTGTDVTKEAASLVLADDNYATIVAAVEEGRAIYANIRKFIFFLLSSNAGAVLFVLTTSILGWEQPLAPIQILWINLITNGLPALALGVDTREPEQMARPPREPGGAILSGSEYLQMLGVGVVMAATALIAFHHFLPNPHHAASGGELAHARAVVFAILSVGPLVHAFNCRSERRSLFALGVFSNRALWGAVVTGILLQAVTIYVPVLRPIFKTAWLSAHDLLWVFGMGAVPFVLGELAKEARVLDPLTYFLLREIDSTRYVQSMEWAARRGAPDGSAGAAADGAASAHRGLARDHRSTGRARARSAHRRGVARRVSLRLRRRERPRRPHRQRDRVALADPVDGDADAAGAAGRSSGALRCDIQTPAGRLAVVTAHLSWELDAPHVREQQILVLDEFARQDPGEIPTLLAGDFNCTPDSLVHQFLTGRASLGGRGTYWRDTYQRRHPHSDGFTWAARNPYVARSVERNRRVDYIFAGPMLDNGPGAILHARVVLDLAVGDDLYPSDHFGVLAEVALTAVANGM